MIVVRLTVGTMGGATVGYILCVELQDNGVQKNINRHNIVEQMEVQTVHKYRN